MKGANCNNCKNKLFFVVSSAVFAWLICFYYLQPVFAQQINTSWWQGTTVYHIYPRSFYDSNGDGIGDLRGITEKLDYIKQLGFETIWISPFFSSPQRDFGYDISDYYTIDPVYGNMTDCERLINEVHKRGMKIIFDLVLNHTSDQHVWFQQSAQEYYNDKTDWYVWRSGRGRNGRKPPNNWKSMIGGSGWHWHEKKRQFYWASFLPFQPDLNYYRDEVKQAMLNMVKFWLSKGVDGFRLDIFSAIYEDQSFKNNPFSFRVVPSETNPAAGFFQKMRYTINHDKSFSFATELRRVVDSFPDKYLVGEVMGNLHEIKKYCDYNGQAGLHSVFLFSTLRTPFRAKAYANLVRSFESCFAYPLVPVYVFSNHDRTRSFSRLGENIEKSKLLALFQFTARGIPFTYYGEELGMPNATLPFKQAQDALAHQYRPFHQWLVKLAGETLNRDECRTPMLWHAGKQAGFTTADSAWLPIYNRYQHINVETQLADSNSLLRFYSRIIACRNQINALKYGTLEIAEQYSSKSIFAFFRMYDTETYLVVLNMRGRKSAFSAPHAEMIVSTHQHIISDKLLPYEGRVYKIKQMNNPVKDK